MKDKIRAVKDSLGLTLRSIADHTGVTATTVSNIISGKMKPREKWLQSFCQAYHISYDWLTTGDGSPVFTQEVSDFEMQDSRGAGKRLVQIRKEYGYTQKVMYDILGITQAMYSRIENGGARLTVENAKKIEDALGVGADWILYGDETRKVYPLGRRMSEYLWRHPEERERLWRLMEKED